MASYVLTAVLSYDGTIVFMEKGEIEDIARAELGTTDTIYTEPIPIGKVSLLWSPRYRGWVRVWNTGKEKK